MEQAIAGYHRDEEGHWVAELRCGHFQHVRHQPPFINRPWVTSAAGRQAMLGMMLNCKKCDRGEPADRLAPDHPSPEET
ncbi:DUF3565 domain-containing protein [Zobellella taiwanensis]|uniref:DUF3565 domain-containing protein n=1 Tax=Zobellella taiwanensis TaxID=347535 RepID=A0A2P7RDK5_9GAMM|nr:DUF3565 domain-containing protein [Zobellella taiwanensis]PSJ48306.1 DUF3565 domain-containing protein [Zobellella taiwanensis]